MIDAAGVEEQASFAFLEGCPEKRFHIAFLEILYSLELVDGNYRGFLQRIQNGKDFFD